MARLPSPKNLRKEKLNLMFDPVPKADKYSVWIQRDGVYIWPLSHVKDPVVDLTRIGRSASKEPLFVSGVYDASVIADNGSLNKSSIPATLTFELKVEEIEEIKATTTIRSAPAVLSKGPALAELTTSNEQTQPTPAPIARAKAPNRKKIVMTAKKSQLSKTTAATPSSVEAAPSSIEVRQIVGTQYCFGGTPGTDLKLAVNDHESQAVAVGGITIGPDGTMVADLTDRNVLKVTGKQIIAGKHTGVAWNGKKTEFRVDFSEEDAKGFAERIAQMGLEATPPATPPPLPSPEKEKGSEVVLVAESTVVPLPATPATPSEPASNPAPEVVAHETFRPQADRPLVTKLGETSAALRDFKPEPPKARIRPPQNILTDGVNLSFQVGEKTELVEIGVVDAAGRFLSPLTKYEKDSEFGKRGHMGLFRWNDSIPLIPQELTIPITAIDVNGERSETVEHKFHLEAGGVAAIMAKRSPTPKKAREPEIEHVDPEEERVPQRTHVPAERTPSPEPEQERVEPQTASSHMDQVLSGIASLSTDVNKVGQAVLESAKVVIGHVTAVQTAVKNSGQEVRVEIGAGIDEVKTEVKSGTSEVKAELGKVQAAVAKLASQAPSGAAPVKPADPVQTVVQYPVPAQNTGSWKWIIGLLIIAVVFLGFLAYLHANQHLPSAAIGMNVVPPPPAAAPAAAPAAPAAPVTPTTEQTKVGEIPQETKQTWWLKDPSAVEPQVAAASPATVTVIEKPKMVTIIERVPVQQAEDCIQQPVQSVAVWPVNYGGYDYYPMPMAGFTIGLGFGGGHRGCRVAPVVQARGYSFPVWARNYASAGGTCQVRGNGRRR